MPASAETMNYLPGNSIVAVPSVEAVVRTVLDGRAHRGCSRRTKTRKVDKTNNKSHGAARATWAQGRISYVPPAEAAGLLPMDALAAGVGGSRLTEEAPLAPPLACAPPARPALPTSQRTPTSQYLHIIHSHAQCIASYQAVALNLIRQSREDHNNLFWSLLQNFVPKLRQLTSNEPKKWLFSLTLFKF